VVWYFVYFYGGYKISIQLKYQSWSTCSASDYRFEETSLNCCLLFADIGSYCTSDKPYPQGEVWLGGGNIALGYYKNPELTDQDFHYLDGKRWFATGDIGRMEPDGCVRIIGKPCCTLYVVGVLDLVFDQTHNRQFWMFEIN
jgi:hypothetical protein